MSVQSWWHNRASAAVGGLLAIVAILGLATSAMAQGDDEEEALFSSGPRHIALLIGNSDYDGDKEVNPLKLPPPGFLTDLRTPCNDAKLMYERLVAAGWERDTGKPDTNTRLRCNLSPAELAAEIDAFRKQVYGAEGAKIVFYYSGHGAEVQGHKYLFGVGVGVNLAKAREQLSAQKPDTSFFQESAYDLRDLLLKIGNQTENAAVVILDSCRNDPLYLYLQSINPESGPRILAPSLSADEYNGVIVTYATQAGHFAVTPPRHRYSIFSGELASHFEPGPKIGDVVDYAISHTVKVTQGWTLPQKPVRYGNLHQPPPWCVGKCSQKDPVRKPIQDDGDDADDAANNGRSSQVVLPASDAVRYFVAPDPPLAADATPLKLAQSPRTLFDASRALRTPDVASPTQTTESTQAVQFDVYWCSGGERSEGLAEQANDLAVSLSEIATADPTGGVLGVRTRVLSPLANSRPSYRHTDNVIVYDAGDPKELEWAVRAGRLPIRVKPVAGDRRTPRYLAAYFCRLPAQASPRVKVYFQVPAKEMKPYAKYLRGEVLAALGSTGKSEEVDTEKEASPADTEIRYYHMEDRDAVFVAVKVLEKQLGHAVSVNFLSRYTSTTKPGRMEVWLGRNEPFRSAPVSPQPVADE